MTFSRKQAVSKTSRDKFVEEPIGMQVRLRAWQVYAARLFSSLRSLALGHKPQVNLLGTHNRESRGNKEGKRESGKVATGVGV